jgi:hypothetical protein
MGMGKGGQILGIGDVACVCGGNTEGGRVLEQQAEMTTVADMYHKLSHQHVLFGVGKTRGVKKKCGNVLTNVPFLAMHLHS